MVFLAKDALVAGESGVAAALCHRSPKYAGALAVAMGDKGVRFAQLEICEKVNENEKIKPN